MGERKGGDDGAIWLALLREAMREAAGAFFEGGCGCDAEACRVRAAVYQAR